MSRAKASNTVSPLSLFPFIGVLLCTMGALLVVLVAVSRQARVQAQHRVEAAQAAAPAASERDVNRDQLEEVHQYVSRVNKLRTDVEQKLQNDQQQLSHLEEHMRRLQDQMVVLRHAGEELIGMEGEHYDDRQQAAREVERLQQLIGETRKAIAALKAEGKANKKSYALVPYEGPNGTFRRPIYVECKGNVVIIQPEGIEFKADDFQQPLGPGNPLASVLRAARTYLIGRDQGNIQTRDTEPYPLILVRPDGALTYALVQRAIEAGDFDFGFELVEEDWKLNYPAVDPQLVNVEYQALEHARMRQQLLAEAAPRAYRRPTGGGAGGRYEFEETPDDGFDGGGRGAPMRGVHVRKTQSRGKAQGDNEPATDDVEAYSGSASQSTSAGGGNSGSDQYGSDQEGAAQQGDAYQPGGNGGTGGPLRSPTGEDGGQAGGSGSGGGPRSGDQPGEGPQSAGQQGVTGGVGGPMSGGSMPGGSQSGGTPPGAAMQANGQSSGMSANSAPPGMDQPGGPQQISTPPPGAPKYVSPHDRPIPAKTRGKDWALLNKNARAVPVRRTIQVVVHQNQLGVLSDEADPKTRGKRSKTIPVSGDTIESLDPFVKAVHEQIDSWGMAGDGLYWRPELVLNIGPDGQRRAEDLTRLLKDSGLDVRNAATAKLESQGTSSATR